MKNKIVIVLIYLSVTFSSAQDIHFSQINAVPLLINPANTGLFNGYYRASVNYRNQWPAMGAPFVTMLASFDAPIQNQRKKSKNGTLGLGGYFYSDKAGDSRFGKTEINFCLSGIVPINQNNKVSAGIQLAYVQHGANLSAIQWPNQYDGKKYDPSMNAHEGFSNVSFSNLDVGIGMQYEYSNAQSLFNVTNQTRITFGAAFIHPTQPLLQYTAVSAEQLYKKLIFNAGIVKDFEDTKLGMQANAIYMLQGPSSQIAGSILLKYKYQQDAKITEYRAESNFLFGVFYRHNDAIAPAFFIQHKDFEIGLTYDFANMFKLTTTKNYSAIEISLKYARMRAGLRKK